jgi:hypothetical protein
MHRKTIKHAAKQLDPSSEHPELTTEDKTQTFQTTNQQEQS